MARMSSRKAAKWLSGSAGTSAILLALPEVFPWVRHLDAEEVREFTVGLPEALSDAADRVPGRLCTGRSSRGGPPPASTLTLSPSLALTLTSSGKRSVRSAASTSARPSHTSEPEESDRVGVPPLSGWNVIHGTTQAATGWEELCRVALPNAHCCLEALCQELLRRTYGRDQVRGDVTRATPYSHTRACLPGDSTLR
ncbi:hypothetical protein [Streptomyces sp. IBSBF 2806]|uniref:hypothetical protein n=1 Tax=Streptomyces sp. IBSBF 2806 TaxID=2903529 RepID=UPI003FA6C676